MLFGFLVVVLHRRWAIALSYFTSGLPAHIHAVKNKRAAEGGEHYNGENQVTHVQVQPGAAPGKEKDEQSQLDQGLDG